MFNKRECPVRWDRSDRIGLHVMFEIKFGLMRSERTSRFLQSEVIKIMWAPFNVRYQPMPAGRVAANCETAMGRNFQESSQADGMYHIESLPNDNNIFARSCVSCLCSICMQIYSFYTCLLLASPHRFLSTRVPRVVERNSSPLEPNGMHKTYTVTLFRATLKNVSWSHDTNKQRGFMRSHISR